MKKQNSYFSDRHENRGVFRALFANPPGYTTIIPSRSDSEGGFRRLLHTPFDRACAVTQNKLIQVIVFSFLLTVITACGRSSGPIKEELSAAGNYHFYNAALEIGNRRYSGPAALADEEGNVYYPLEGLRPYFEDSLKAADGGEYLWKEDLRIVPDDQDVILLDGESYVSEKYLTEKMDLNLYVNGEARFLDDYPKLDYSWTKYRVVYHGCGGIDDKTYTNSREALLKNYADGARLFEIDFSMSADGEPVCAHDWNMEYRIMDIPFVKTEDGREEPVPLRVEDFKKHVIQGKYTPMSLEDLYDIMRENKDMYVITDTKDGDTDSINVMFQAFVDVAERGDSSVLDRIIPQVYNNKMFSQIMEIHDWKSVVYTLYNYGDSFRYQRVYSFARENGIKVFTTSTDRDDMIFINPMVERGAKFYMHTYNVLEEVEEILDHKKIYGVYTDFLAPDALDRFPYPYED